MAPRTEIPTGDRYRSEWARLDKDARRRVRRAANRGRAVEGGNPREAALAAALAVNQQRFWRWGWVIGPVFVGVVTVVDTGIVAALINAAIVGVVVGAMAVYFYRRAQRAEAENREVMARPAKGRSRRNRRKGKRLG